MVGMLGGWDAGTNVARSPAFPAKRALSESRTGDRRESDPGRDPVVVITSHAECFDTAAVCHRGVRTVAGRPSAAASQHVEARGPSASALGPRAERLVHDHPLAIHL